MNKFYQVQVNILNMILRFMVGFTLLGMIALQYTQDDDLVYALFLLIPASVVSLLIGRFAKHIWSYYALQFVIVIIYWLTVDNLLLRILYCGFIIINATIQFMTALKEMNVNISWAFVFIILMMYIDCKYQFPQLVKLSRFYLYFSVFYLLFYILNIYYVNFNTYFKQHEGVYQIPINQIKLSNNFFIAAIVSICFAVMFLFTEFPAEKIFFGIVKQIGKLIAFVFGGIAKHEHIEGTKGTIAEMTANKGDGSGGGDSPIPKELVQKVKADNFWYYAIKILFALLVILASIAAVVLIINLCIQIYKMFYRKRTGSIENEIEFISPFKATKKENIKREKVSVNIFHNIFGRNNNGRIRKHFYKAVLGHANRDVALEYLTPAQLSAYALRAEEKPVQAQSDMDKEKKITALYEKARYSGVDCSSEEVQLIKDLIKEGRQAAKK